MGILDSKTRIMDVVLTQEGKRQLASGRFQGEFISFSDSQAFYEYDAASGSYAATDRIYFESAINMPQDVITIESDDSGKLINFNSTPQLTIFGNQIFTTASLQDVNRISVVTTGSSFASLSTEVIESIFQNYNSNYFLATKENPEQQDFSLSTEDITFKITNSVPFLLGPSREKINLNSIEPIFIDKRLSHLQNFKFLPPDNGEGEDLGAYTALNQKAPLTYQDFLDEIGKPENISTTTEYTDDPFTQIRIQEILDNNFTEGNLKPYKERFTINFNSNSRESNLLMQMFETSNNKISKLDVIDFGVFNDDEDPKYPTKQVYFVGKVYVDDAGFPTFVNLFDIILE
jgi:hypothetical protein